MFLGQEMHYYMVCIAYFTELILQICDYAQKRRIWRKNFKYALDENFYCHFCSRRKAAKFCHPDDDDDDDDDDDGAVTNHSLVCNMSEKTTNLSVAENIQFNGCCLPSFGLPSFQTRPWQRRSF